MQTHGFLGRVADVLARQLLGWLRRRVEPASREWLDALAAEAECADGDWQRLRWALGGVPLVWTINRRRRVKEPARGAQRARVVSGVANVAAIAGWCAVITAATYAAADFFRCHLLLGNQPGGCQEHPLVFGSIAIGGGLLGMITALALRARLAAYWWTVSSVCCTVGCVWYLCAGIEDLPRYGATQPAMLMAATLGVVLAAIMRDTRSAETERGPMQPVGDGAEAPTSLLSRHRMAAHVVAGTISFAMADSLIRLRDRPLTADSVNHYAVLGAAMFAALLAGLIGRRGSRLPARGTIGRL